MTPRGHLHLGAVRVTSPAFEHGTAIPIRYTAAGDAVLVQVVQRHLPGHRDG